MRSYGQTDGQTDMYTLYMVGNASYIFVTCVTHFLTKILHHFSRVTGIKKLINYKFNLNEFNFGIHRTLELEKFDLWKLRLIKKNPCFFNIECGI